jgi:hypothetical protein
MAIPQRHYTHYSTPIKTRLRGQVQLLKALNRDLDQPGVTTKRQLFRESKIPARSGYRILASTRDRRTLDQETRGRKPKLTDADLRYLELIIQRTGWDGRVLTWSGLATEANLNVSWRTIQREMKTLDYRRCIACKASWVSPNHAARRLEWASYILAKYPEPEDWKNVRFSDESHAGFGPSGSLYVIRKPGERECPDCVQTVKEPRDKDQKKVHMWGVIGYRYKSKLHRYEAPNKNGKMTMNIYKQLLIEECTGWPSD